MNKRKTDEEQENENLQRLVLWILVAVGCAIGWGLFDELGYYSNETRLARQHGCIAPSPYPEVIEQ